MMAEQVHKNIDKNEEILAIMSEILNLTAEERKMVLSAIKSGKLSKPDVEFS